MNHSRSMFDTGGDVAPTKLILLQKSLGRHGCLAVQSAVKTQLPMRQMDCPHIDLSGEMEVS